MARYTRYAAIAGLLLAVSALLWYVTRPSGLRPVPASPSATLAVVDDGLLKNARRLWIAADSLDAQPLASEAIRIADHEVDLAFGTALREAVTGPVQTTGPTKELAGRIADLRSRIAASEKQLEAMESGGDTAGRADLLKAQLALDQNELEDAREDLARIGGDPRARMEQALQEHQAMQHAGALAKAPLVVAPTTLFTQIGRWAELSDRRQDIEDAEKQVLLRAARLQGEHEAIERGLAGKSGDKADDEDVNDTIARLKRLSGQKKSLTERDRRVQDCLQLAEVYGRWLSVIGVERRAVFHAGLQSIAMIFGIVLSVILGGALIRKLLGDHRDRRRLHQLRVVSAIVVQAAGAILILLVIFGAPTQTSTLIGLATAGLTVALKDFIVAFFGWFALIGKNGIRVGDWVEIEGVSGEVVEIGLLKTVLLEMGNWTSSSHPTGRRVAFVNKYAIENHYFNFSTEGQWLWDELQMTLPQDSNPYVLSEQIRDIVVRETEADARQAESDWERVTRQYGSRPFSAEPVIDLRPAVKGFDIVVRYITRAPQRYEVKSRLFSAIVTLLQTGVIASTASPAAPG